MPQRRINLPFVRSSLLVVVVVLCGLLLFKLKSMMGKGSKYYEDQYDTIIKTGSEGAPKAGEFLLQAVNADPRNVRLRMKYANFLYDMAITEGDQDQYSELANKQWNTVLETEPSNKDALGKILDIDVKKVESFHSSTGTFTELQNVASRILKLNENDSRFNAQDKQDLIDLKRRANAYSRISVIAAWLRGIATPPSALEDNLKGLKKILDEDLAANDPARINPDVPYYLCEGYIKQAQESRAAGDNSVATAKEKLAYQTFSGVFAKAPDNPTLALNYYVVLRGLTIGVDEDDAQSDRAEYVKRIGEALAQARVDARLHPDNPSVLEIYQEYASFLARRSRLKQDATSVLTLPTSKPVRGDLTIEILLDELLELRPDDQQARILYANWLRDDPKRRAKAIELLERPLVESNRNTSTALYHPGKRDLQADTERELIELLLEQFQAATDPAQRKALNQQVDDHYAKLVELRPTDYRTFFTKGFIALKVKPGKEGAIEAIPLLERSRDMLRQSKGDRAHDRSLDKCLAQAYSLATQTGLARNQWQLVVDRQPENVDAHKQLAGLLIDEDQVDQARAELQKVRDLEKADAKNDMELQRLDVMLLMKNPEKIGPAAMEKLLSSMPEKTPDQIRAKIPFLLVAGGHTPDLMRLYELLRTKDPADVDTDRTLVQIYSSQGKADLAAKVVKDGLAKTPDSIPLQILDAQLKKDVPRIIELTKKGIESITDPTRREISFFEFYKSSGDKTEAQKHLDAAEKSAPDDATVLDIRFTYALESSQFSDAERYMAKLAEQNADQAHGLIYKFRLAEARKDLKAAEDVASEMVDTFPAFARSWVDFGDVLRQKGKYDDAIAKYTMALDRQAGNLESLRGIVECYLLMNSPRLEDAKSYIDQGRKLFPHDPWFKEREVAWFLDNDPKQAIPTREQEAKAAPDKIGPQIALYAAWWELAKQQLQKGKPEDAHQPMQKAHDGFAQVLTKWPGEQELEYAYFADICSQIGDFQGGEKALKEMAAVPKWKDNPKPTIMLAEYYGRIGKQAEAEAAWKDALMLSKNAPGVRQQVAAYYLGVHKYDEALKLVDVNAKDRPTQQLLIQIYMASGKLTDAEKYLDAMLKDAPDDSRLLSIKGMLMLQEDKTASALDQLNKALLADPKNASAYFDRGLIHLRLGQADLPDAIKDFTSARDLADTGNLALQVQSRLSLGEAMRAHGQSEEAITELSAALRMQPSNKELRMRLIEMLGTLLTPRWSDVENLIHEAQNMPDFRKDPDWWRVEAQMWAQRKEDEKSLTAIREALRLSAGQPQRIVPLMQDYLMVLIKLKHFPELESEAGELLKSPQIVDSGWWVYQARAIAEARQGQKQEALDDFDKGLEITNRLRNDDGTMMIVQSISDTIGVDQAIARLEKEAAKGDNHWRVIIVDLYLNKQDYPRAQAKVEALLADIDKLKPSEQEATYVVAGLTYMLSGKYEQARSMYEKLLAVQPNDTVALNNLACLYSDDLNPPDAAKALGFSTRAFELMQKSGQMDPNVLETQGWILVRNNRVDEGISNIQMALDRRAIMEGYYHLGYAFLQKKLALEAQAALERAQKMLNDRKDKGEPIDAKLQSSITDTLAKAKSMANGPATAPGTRPAVKP